MVMVSVKEITDLIVGGINKKDGELINKAYEFAKARTKGKKE